MGQMMYCTDYVATVVYEGRPDAGNGTVQENLFDEGVRMGSFGMLLHSVVGRTTYYGIFVATIFFKE